jgi:hypothetical protein
LVLVSLEAEGWALMPVVSVPASVKELERLPSLAAVRVLALVLVLAKTEPLE